MPFNMYPLFRIFFFFSFRDRFQRESRRNTDNQERGNTAHNENQHTDRTPHRRRHPIRPQEINLLHSTDWPAHAHPPVDSSGSTEQISRPDIRGLRDDCSPSRYPCQTIILKGAKHLLMSNLDAANYDDFMERKFELLIEPATESTRATRHRKDPSIGLRSSPRCLPSAPAI
jgi:hypothetical protein